MKYQIIDNQPEAGLMKEEIIRRKKKRMASLALCLERKISLMAIKVLFRMILKC